MSAQGGIREFHVNDDDEELVVHEPWAEAAELAYKLARSSCRPDCVAYHGLVGYMRQLQLVPAPERHGRFFRDQLVDAANRGARDVLIAGAADQSMLAHVLAAFAAAGQRPDVTLVDQCPTPLRINEWFAAQKTVRLATECSDLTALTHAGAFDIICTDGVLMLIEPDRRLETLRRWALALRPGGRLITHVRLGAWPDGLERQREAMAAAFAARVESEAQLRPGLLPMEPARLSEMSRAYLLSIRTYPFESVEVVERQFAATGLELAALDVRPMAGRVGHHEGGPGTLQSSTTVRLVAVRREGLRSAAGLAAAGRR